MPGGPSACGGFLYSMFEIIQLPSCLIKMAERQGFSEMHFRNLFDNITLQDKFFSQFKLALLCSFVSLCLNACVLVIDGHNMVTNSSTRHCHIGKLGKLINRWSIKNVWSEISVPPSPSTFPSIGHERDGKLMNR